jgi:hypothetical protein
MAMFFYFFVGCNEIQIIFTYINFISKIIPKYSVYLCCVA